MALVENTLFGEINKVDIAIERFKTFEPEDGYYLAFSGGKDSVVVKRLAEMAGVAFDAHYAVTSVDPPELVRFVKRHKNVSFDIQHDKDGKPITMWNLIPKKRLPPTRIVRYCCEKLKESSAVGRVVVTGVRWAESVRRSKTRALVNIGTKRNGMRLNYDDGETARMVEQCYRTQRTLVNPIIDWTDEDVWEFIKSENVPYCELYDCGFKRLGCIGCPMASKTREKEFETWPKYKELYLRAFQRMIDKNLEDGITQKWTTAEEVFDWWMNDKRTDTPTPLFDEGT